MELEGSACTPRGCDSSSRMSSSVDDGMRVLEGTLPLEGGKPKKVPEGTVPSGVNPTLSALAVVF